MFDMLHNWFVVQGVNEGVPYFWSTPIGGISVFIILTCSFIHIFKGKPDLIDSLYYWALAGICSIAMLHIAENSNPRHQMMVIVLALAVHKLWGVIKLFRGNK